MDSGAFSGVEHAGLNERIICRQTHLTAQRIHLADQVSLAGSANGGVAGHEGNTVQIQGKKKDGAADPGACEGRLAAGVSCSDDNDIKLFHGFLCISISPLSERKVPVRIGYFSGFA
jgi:hypothetical protein